MGYMKDSTGRRLDTFQVADATAAAAGSYGIPATSIAAWYAGDDLSGALGDPVKRWADRTGKGIALLALTNPPTLKPTGLNGMPTVVFTTATAPLVNNAFGTNTDPSQGAAHAQPLTHFAVAKLASSGAGTAATVVGGGSPRVDMQINAVTGCPTPYAGTNPGYQGGASLFDDTWHVIAVQAASGAASAYVDGYLTGSDISAGANGMGKYGVGNIATATTSAPMEIAEVLTIDGIVSPGRIATITQLLSAKWGLGLTVPAQSGAPFIDTNDSGGINCRVWVPASIPAGGAPLVILSHQHSGSEAVQQGTPGYPVVRALVQAGYVVAMSRMGGDTWGNAAAIASLNNLYTLVTSTIGLSISRVVMGGMSMGGVATSLAISGATTIPNIKGAFGIDAVFSLSSMYSNATYTASITTAYSITAGTLSAATTAGATSIPTTASFPTTGTQLMVGNGTAQSEIVTTTGPSTGTSVPVTAMANAHASGEAVSDFPTKTSGHDPILIPAASYPAAKRWHFYASSGDTAVPKTANVDAFRTLLAGNAPAESALVTHSGGHLNPDAFQPKDVVAFCNRCT